MMMMMMQQTRKRMMMMKNNNNRIIIIKQQQQQQLPQVSHRTLSVDNIINSTIQSTSIHSSNSHNSSRSRALLSMVDQRGQVKHYSSSSSSSSPQLQLLPQPNPRRSLEFRTIIELQQKAVLAYPDNPMLGTSSVICII